LRAPLLRFVSLQRIGSRRAIWPCRKPDDPASAIGPICAPCVFGPRSIALLRFYARADGGCLRLACAGSTRIMHRRSPVRRCTAIRPNDLATLPASSFRQRSWDFHPSQLCSCSRVRIASRPRAPTCRFASNPTPIISSGGQPLNTTPTTFATGRGRSPRLLGFLLASKPFPSSSCRMGRYCHGLVPLSGFRTPETPACQQALLARANPLNHGCRFRHPDAHEFSWRCRCAATAQNRRAFRDALSRIPRRPFSVHG